MGFGRGGQGGGPEGVSGGVPEGVCQGVLFFEWFWCCFLVLVAYTYVHILLSIYICIEIPYSFVILEPSTELCKNIQKNRSNKKLKDN